MALSGWDSCEGKGIWEGLCSHPWSSLEGTCSHTHFLSQGNKQRRALEV